MQRSGVGSFLSQDPNSFVEQNGLIDVDTADQEYRSNSDHGEDLDNFDVNLDGTNKDGEEVKEKIETTPTKENPLADMN